MSKLRIYTMLLLAGVLLTINLSANSHAGAPQVLMMATTTSTDNTGLLDYLAPKFREDTGIELKWTAVGTGKALKFAENCDVDVLMVHSPKDEKVFLESGFGMDRREFMYNDFVVIGPVSDPVGIKGKSTLEALTRIRETRTCFISRGDNSGTHEMELTLWKSTGLAIPEREKWYIQTGQGMLTTISMAAERNGYTLTDRGTYFRYEADQGENTPLKILVEGDNVLLNQYSVIAVCPMHCPKVKNNLATRFMDWICGKKAQELIGEFKLHGKPLFTPNAKK